MHVPIGCLLVVVADLRQGENIRFTPRRDRVDPVGSTCTPYSLLSFPKVNQKQTTLVSMHRNRIQGYVEWMKHDYKLAAL